MTTTTTSAVVVALAIIGLSAGVVRTFSSHILPVSWTDEPGRLAMLLDLAPGQRVAEIGAGDGAMAFELVRRLGADGMLYATELDEGKLRSLQSRAAGATGSQMRVIAANASVTNLPDECCHAAYLRMVFHHIDDQMAYAHEVARAIRSGGRLAVIDFAPGALFFLGRRHGVEADTVVAAFERAGLALVSRDDNWGGRTFAVAFIKR